MDLGLKDRVAIIGGSSRGLGRAIALSFAQEGANVAISARTEADLRRTEIELARVGSQQHVLAIPADLSVARDIRRVVRDTFNRFGQLGILVTHMGYGPPGRPSHPVPRTPSPLHHPRIPGCKARCRCSAVLPTSGVAPHLSQLSPYPS